MTTAQLGTDAAIMRPTDGLLLHFWFRHKFGFRILLGWLTLSIIAADAVPPSVMSTDYLFLFLIPLFCAFPYLLGVFAHPDGDLAPLGSGYPSYLFTLPVRTKRLVFVPVISGVIVINLFWLILANAILRPRGINAPPVWPGIMISAILLLLQALFWSPMSLPLQRAGLLVMGVTGYIAIGIYSHFNGISSWLISLFFTGISAVIGWAAYEGLTKARRGDAANWTPSLQFTRSKPSISTDFTPFRSALQAQVWFEWERSGKMFVWLLSISCALLAIPLFIVADFVPVPMLDRMLSSSGHATLEVSFQPFLVFGLFFLPLWLGLMYGGGLRKADTRRKDLQLDLHFATRPMTSWNLVVAKWIAGLKATLFSWVAVLVLAGCVLCTTARQTVQPPLPDAVVRLTNLPPKRISREMMAEISKAQRQAERDTVVSKRPLIAFLLPNLTPRLWALSILVLILLVFATWRNQIVGAYVDFAGRPWVQYAPVVIFCLMPSVMTLGGGRVLAREGNPQPLLDSLPLIGLAMIIFKLPAAVLILTQLVRFRIATLQSVVVAFAAWAACVGAVTWLLVVLTPAGLLVPKYVLLASAVFIPLARPALAPLALEWNRRR